MSSVPKPLVLLILDGWGIAPPSENNLISVAATPNWDQYWAEFPHTTIGAAGEAIGLPTGHQGSTEIGHYIIGAGRNALLPQAQVSAALATRTVDNVPAYAEALAYAQREDKAVHFFGLLQDSGVHAYSALGLELVRAAADLGLTQVYIHLCLDGRDSPPQSARDLLPEFVRELERTGVGQIASLMGRWWGMDRDHRWERVQRAYHTIVDGTGDYQAADPIAALDAAYARGETDEFVTPTTIVDATGRPITPPVRDGDVVINWNFRVDREIEITQAFVEQSFEGFVRQRFPQVRFVATTAYYEDLQAPVAFHRPAVEQPLGEVVSRADKKQFRITETEKWPYVTKIFNAMREEPYPGEERLLLPSDKVATFDLAPRMQTKKITDAVIKRLHAGEDDLIVINYPNPDMLAHAGNREAIIIGIEECDRQLGRLAEAVRLAGGALLVTADHGNAEMHLDEQTDEIHTQHTTAEVPFLVISDLPDVRSIELRDGGALQDVAPTMLKLLELSIPEVMTGTPFC